MHTRDIYSSDHHPYIDLYSVGSINGNMETAIDVGETEEEIKKETSLTKAYDA